MFKKIFILCIATLIFLVRITTAHATTVERLNLEDLSKRAHVIVIGTVRSSRTAWDARGRIILTITTVDVQETIKGQPAQTIEITTAGGRIGNTILHVAGMPAFASGENAIIFIEKSALYSTVLGLGQGKFTISNGEVSNAISGLSFPNGQLPRTTNMPLAEFKKQIHQILDRRP